MTDLLKPYILRAITYGLTVALGLVFTWLSSLGYGSYDAATGLFDPHPVSLYVIVPALAGMIGAPALALIALIKGWGRK